jgi:hypothetical protein
MIMILDDIRTPQTLGYEPKECLVFTEVETAIKSFLYLQDSLEIVTLDHDLGGDDPENTGYAFLKFLEQMAFSGELSNRSLIGSRTLPEFRVHSQNPIGKERMLVAIEKIEQYYQQHLPDVEEKVPAPAPAQEEEVGEQEREDMAVADAMEVRANLIAEQMDARWGDAEEEERDILERDIAVREAMQRHADRLERAGLARVGNGLGPLGGIPPEGLLEIGGREHPRFPPLWPPNENEAPWPIAPPLGDE